MKFSLIVIIFILNCLPIAYCQSIEGKIVDEKGNPLSSVVINNRNEGIRVFSDSVGNFSIFANVKDSLTFSILGYYTLNLKIPDSGIDFRRFVMKPMPFTLKEVEIHPEWTPYESDSIERRATYKLTLDRKKEKSLMSPVSAIAENISRKSRQRWQFQKHFAQWENQKYIDSRYTFSEVSKLTGLKDDSLAAFINTYPMSFDYARAASDLEIKMWILFNYRQWMKNPYVPKLDTL